MKHRSGCYAGRPQRIDAATDDEAARRLWVNTEKTNERGIILSRLRVLFNTFQSVNAARLITRGSCFPSRGLGWFLSQLESFNSTKDWNRATSDFKESP